jgi:16S rRNA (uracil1498-N3)-methyltransferase
MYRFFVPPETLQSEPVVLRDVQAHRISHVLRLTRGDKVLLLDNSGWAYELELTRFDRDAVEGRVVRKILASGEPRAKITLYQALLKGASFDLVLEKCTEIGVVEFVPLLCERCVVGSLMDAEDHRLKRWERIIRGAAEQSRRGRLPRLSPVTMFPLAIQRARRADLSVLPWEEAKGPSLSGALAELRESLATMETPGADALAVLRAALTGLEQALAPAEVSGEDTTTLRAALAGYRDAAGKLARPYTISLFIGPEGGFTKEEVQLARGEVIRPVTLGPRILRAETAGLAASAAILYAMGDME